MNVFSLLLKELIFDFYLYNRQIVGIPIGTNGAPFVVDLFLFWFERDFMMSLSREDQADLTDSFNSTSRYLDELLNIDNLHLKKKWLTGYSLLNIN